MEVRSEVGGVGIPPPCVVSSDAVVVMWMERDDLLPSLWRCKLSFGTQCHYEGLSVLASCSAAPFLALWLKRVAFH